MRALLVLLVVGCAHAEPDPLPLKVSMIPVELDVDKLVQQEDPKKVEPFGEQFDDIPVDEGNACKLPPGILLSETSYAQVTRDQSNLKLCRVQRDTYQDLRRKERAAVLGAESEYQKKIAALEAKLAEGPSLWERIDMPVGVAVGIGLTLGVLKAAVEVADAR